MKVWTPKLRKDTKKNNTKDEEGIDKNCIKVTILKLEEQAFIELADIIEQIYRL